MKRRELEARLRALGWALRRHGGRHDVWGRGDLELAVPRHTEINEQLARALLRRAEGKA
jgi:mRNA interferase HicA